MSQVSSHIQDMAGYVYGEQPDDPHVVKLNTNENPYPPSPRVMEDLQTLDYSLLRRYPDATGQQLCQTLADMHGLEPAQVLLTNGGDEGIRLLATACVEKSGVVMAAEPSYSLYPVIAAIQNASYIPLALSASFTLPEDAPKRIAESNADLVCIANPNAPSGVLLDVETIRVLLRGVDCVVLLDEAYVDFVDPKLDHDLIPLISQHPNLVILRTLSKGYSLAGLRLGYLLGNAELLTEISSKVRDSYNVGLLPQILGQAALNDRTYAEQTWHKVRLERMKLTKALHALDFDVPLSQANFLLPSAKIGKSMQRVYEALRERHVLVRHFDTPKLTHRLRITVGSPEENETLLAKLTECL